MPTDKSYFDNASEQISLITGTQIEGFKKGNQECDTIKIMIPKSSLPKL